MGDYIIKIPGRSTQAVEQGLKALRNLYRERFSQVFRSITSDNGNEFASLPQLLPTIPIYYAHPYSAYERGMNEKQNSLLHRFLQKDCTFDDIADEKISPFTTVRRRNYFRLSYLILQSRTYVYSAIFSKVLPFEPPAFTFASASLTRSRE